MEQILITRDLENLDAEFPHILLHPQIFHLKMFDASGASAHHDSSTSGGVDLVLGPAPLFNETFAQQTDETEEFSDSLYAALQFSLAGRKPWAPEISNPLFSLRSGHPDFIVPVICRIKMG